MQLGPRWCGLYSHHLLSREEDWVFLIPSYNQKPYSPNLWCKDSNQRMNVGKCYFSSALLTLGHKKGLTGPPNGMEKWICYEEEGSSIPSGRETPDKIEGS